MKTIFIASATVDAESFVFFFFFKLTQDGD